MMHLYLGSKLRNWVHTLQMMHFRITVTCFRILFRFLHESGDSLLGYAVNLLYDQFRLNSFSVLVSANWAGCFVWPLGGEFLWIFPKYFTFLRGVPRDTQQVFFPTGRLINIMTCILFLTLSRVALLGVGCLGILYSLTFPTIAGMVVIWPVGFFRRCPPLVEFLGDFHLLKNIIGFPVCSDLEVPSL